MYEGLQESFVSLAALLAEEGPFDGVLGFSQGGAVAAVLTAVLEDARVFPGDLGFPSPFSSSSHPRLKFCVVYSGFRAADERFAGFFKRKIRTPSLHFLGQVDGVVEEGRSRALVGCWEEGRADVVVHPGGHFLPCQRVWVDVLGGFIRGRMKGEDGGMEESEEKVEDMDVPF